MLDDEWWDTAYGPLRSPTLKGGMGNLLLDTSHIVNSFFVLIQVPPPFPPLQMRSVLG